MRSVRFGVNKTKTEDSKPDAAEDERTAEHATREQITGRPM